MENKKWTEGANHKFYVIISIILCKVFHIFNPLYSRVVKYMPAQGP